MYEALESVYERMRKDAILRAAIERLTTIRLPYDIHNSMKWDTDLCDNYKKQQNVLQDVSLVAAALIDCLKRLEEKDGTNQTADTNRDGRTATGS